MTGSELLKQTEQLVQILNSIKTLTAKKDETIDSSEFLFYSDKGAVLTWRPISLKECGDELYDELSRRLGN